MAAGQPQKLGHTKKRPIEQGGDSVSLAEAFPEYAVNPLGAALRGARAREGLTQRELVALTGIPQRHISEMESGKRTIGKERARKLAESLHVADYRVFL